jgi:hypothetical protein
MTFDWMTRLRTRAFPANGRILLWFGVLASLVGAARCPAATAASPDLSGTWKLVAEGPLDAEWAIIEIKESVGGPTIEILDSSKVLGKPRVYLARSPGELLVLVAIEQADITFKGRLPDGDRGGRIAGAMQFRAEHGVSTSGARLEKTQLRKVAEPKNEPEKSDAARAVNLLLAMRKATAEFGDDRYNELELAAVRAAVAGVPIDARTSARVWAMSYLVDVARRAGKSDAAAQAELATLHDRIALEGSRKQVPLLVDPVTVSRGPDQDEVVLVELFTGAQCGPCVAADVAFDALSTAYKPVDVITLQYHLHIPGPDPLTSPASLSRKEYYGVRSTPSTFFNGRALARGGGPAGESRGKYHQYGHIIDTMLKGKRRAAIDLTARRTGDEISIRSEARLVGGAGAPPGKPRLRLALIEDSVAYTGRNGLPTHHHVVRAMPGDAEGRALEGDKIQIAETIKLGDVRNAQEAYVKAYPTAPESRGGFPGKMPTVELEKLSVVALVQDDSDHSVLGARMVPVD